MQKTLVLWMSNRQSTSSLFVKAVEQILHLLKNQKVELNYLHGRSLYSVLQRNMG